MMFVMSALGSQPIGCVAIRSVVSKVQTGAVGCCITISFRLTV